MRASWARRRPTSPSCSPTARRWMTYPGATTWDDGPNGVEMNAIFPGADADHARQPRCRHRCRLGRTGHGLPGCPRRSGCRLQLSTGSGRAGRLPGPRFIVLRSPVPWRLTTSNPLKAISRGDRSRCPHSRHGRRPRADLARFRPGQRRRLSQRPQPLEPQRSKPPRWR